VSARRTEATIIHADLDSFFASVEQRDDASLRGRPVIVGRGVVLAASYEARAFGIHSAMGGREARRRCPHAAVVDPRMEAYSEASRAVFAVFDDTTPAVEPVSIDEAFLDVSGMRRIAGSPRAIAERLRARVREEVGLPITVGIATTKHLAKVASASGKPDGLLEVPAGQELSFLHPLPVERLWGVGPRTAERLHAHGLVTVGDLAALGEAALVDVVGRAAGRHLHALAHNRDPRRVRARRRRSIGSQRALGRGIRTADELDAIAAGLIDRIARRLRGASRLCRTVVLRLRFDDFTRATRSHTMGEPTAATGTILTTARGLLAAAAPEIERRGITLLGFSLANLLEAGDPQLALHTEAEQATALDRTLDQVRERFGSAAIMRGTAVNRDPGVVMPVLPD
jgi:DNA polymerase-4